MMNLDWLTWLLQATLMTTVAIAVIWVLRPTWRKFFGSRAAILLWLLVPLAALMPLAPDRIVEHPETLTIMLAPSAVWPTQDPAAPADPAPAPAAAFRVGPELVLIGWALGAMGMLWLLAVRQRRFRASLGRLQAGGGRIWISESCNIGPVVLGAISPRIIVPADFRDRFDTRQRRLMLAHEYAHLRCGDPVWNLIAAAFRCVFWFNPLIHIAANGFRRDQELACDARVLEGRRRSRRCYAAALIALEHSEDTYLAPAFGPHPLKERIVQISTMKSLNGKRRNSGAMAAVGVSLLFAFGAWAVTPSTELISVAPSEQEMPEFFAFDVEVTVGGQTGTGRLSMRGDEGRIASHDSELVLLARDTLTIHYQEDEPGWRAEVAISRLDQAQFLVEGEIWQGGALKSTPMLIVGKERPAWLEVSGAGSEGQSLRMQLTPVSEIPGVPRTSPTPVEEWPDEVRAMVAADAGQLGSRPPLMIIDFPDGQEDGSSVSAGDARGTSMIYCGQAPCAVRWCDGAECHVIGFHGGESHILGVVPNSDYLIKRMVEEFSTRVSAED